MAQLGDLRFDCPYCGQPVTVPVREIDGGRYAVEVAADLSVIRSHMLAAHPELAEPAKPAHPEQPGSDQAALRGGRMANEHTFVVSFEASGEVTPAPKPDEETQPDQPESDAETETEPEPEEAEQ